jgi:peptide/nickel transport system ATP-binding protein
MASLIELRNTSKTFGTGWFSRKTVALRDFSMSVDEGDPTITALVGESGSGKTTIARLILGIIPPTSGEVLYRGHPVGRLSRAERGQFRRDVQVIFQDPFEVYNPFYKVDHALHLPVRKAGLASSRDEAVEVIESTLRQVGLNPRDTLGRYPHQLSGGQRQRVMVARALLLNPKLIVADEPVSMVDASLRATILENLRQLNTEFGISILYITHDLTTAYEISEKIVVLYRGGVAEQGDVVPVVQEPQHPYTQLLIGSIPMPDPDQRWQQGLEVVASSSEGAASAMTDEYAGCQFADRCPHAMEMCKDAPPLYETSQHRVVSCHLYRDSARV